MDENELIELIKNSTALQETLFRAVVQHPEFRQEVGEAMNRYRDDADSREASCWV